MGGIEQMGLIVLKLNQQMVTVGQGCREFFLGVHGAEGEQASGQAQSGDHVLGSSAAERRLTTRTSGCQAVRAGTAVPDPFRTFLGPMRMNWFDLRTIAGLARSAPPVQRWICP